ncbi:MAG: 6-phosphofructokinase [Planctomycetia bacterium]|nr:6-phosphofructokinase [Planctomycetia bacterium]
MDTDRRKFDRRRGTAGVELAQALASPERFEHNLHRVAMLFAGGPAPAANAVISTAAASFLKNGIEVLGVLRGYSNLLKYAPDQPLQKGKHYVMMTPQMLRRTRSSQGVMIGTARDNPGKQVQEAAHLSDPQRAEPLRRVYDALCSLSVDALVSIGGDDTLKSANMFKRFQETLPRGARRIPVVHLPKTIDNDYHGIDFTFGYFTAVDFLATEIRNLLYDADANSGYFLAETMGRSAGWLAYGAAIAGEASLVISVEDIDEQYAAAEPEHVDKKTGKTLPPRRIMNMSAVVGRIVDTMISREQEGKPFGVVVIAEGLAELLPYKYIQNVRRDDHGHLAIADVGMYRIFAELVGKTYKRRTGKSRKVVGVQLGYESRCTRPHAFDVMLGSQLGVGAYRALVEKRLNGVMVSITGQLELAFVPFGELVDQKTLKTRVRYIDPRSDFHKLARFLETYVKSAEQGILLKRKGKQG